MDNLANAAVKKNTSLESLVAANKTLTEEITRMLRTIATLSLCGTQSNGTGGTRSNGTGGDGDGAAAPPWDPTGYCWSHGYKVRCGHSSATCERRKESHDSHVTAKRGDIQGGCLWNKSWVFRS